MYLWIDKWNKRIQWTVQRIGKVHSPEQNRAYQRVSMYHQLLIASQYLSSRFPPIYRPRLPPLVLSHPKGISTKDHFPTAMKKKKILNTTANLLPNIKITNDICFFLSLLIFYLFFFLSCSAWYNFLDRLTLKRYDTWNILTDTPNDIRWFSIYSIFKSYATNYCSSFVNDRNNIWENCQ